MPPQAYRTDFWQLVTTNGLSTNTTVDIIHFFHIVDVYRLEIVRYNVMETRS